MSKNVSKSVSETCREIAQKIGAGMRAQSEQKPHLIAQSFMLRFVNSPTYLATVPSSVVQTGVKSAGCEKRMPAA